MKSLEERASQMTSRYLTVLFGYYVFNSSLLLETMFDRGFERKCNLIYMFYDVNSPQIVYYILLQDIHVKSDGQYGQYIYISRIIRICGQKWSLDVFYKMVFMSYSHWTDWIRFAIVISTQR